jgi:hypothetical protein
MYVVGADLLKEFWRGHPASEGELRALHALLSSLEAAELGAALGHVASFDGPAAEIALATARVRIEISQAAGVARYAGIEPIEEESP